MSGPARAASPAWAPTWPEGIASRQRLRAAARFSFSSNAFEAILSGAVAGAGGDARRRSSRARRRSPPTRCSRMRRAASSSAARAPGSPPSRASRPVRRADLAGPARWEGSADHRRHGESRTPRPRDVAHRERSTRPPAPPPRTAPRRDPYREAGVQLACRGSGQQRVRCLPRTARCAAWDGCRSTRSASIPVRSPARSRRWSRRGRACGLAGHLVEQPARHSLQRQPRRSTRATRWPSAAAGTTSPSTSTSSTTRSLLLGAGVLGGRPDVALLIVVAPGISARTFLGPPTGAAR